MTLYRFENLPEDVFTKNEFNTIKNVLVSLHHGRPVEPSTSRCMNSINAQSHISSSPVNANNFSYNTSASSIITPPESQIDNFSNNSQLGRISSGLSTNTSTNNSSVPLTGASVNGDFPVLASQLDAIADIPPVTYQSIPIQSTYQYSSRANDAEDEMLNDYDSDSDIYIDEVDDYIIEDEMDFTTPEDISKSVDDVFNNDDTDFNSSDERHWDTDISDYSDSDDNESLFDEPIRSKHQCISQASQSSVPSSKKCSVLGSMQRQQELEKSQRRDDLINYIIPRTLNSSIFLNSMPALFNIPVEIGPPAAPIHYHLKNGKVHFQDLGCLLMGFNQYGRPVVGMEDKEYVAAAMVFSFATMLYECINSPYCETLSNLIINGHMTPYQFVCALGRKTIFQDYLRVVQWNELDRIFPIQQYRFILSTFLHIDIPETSVPTHALEQYLMRL